MNKIVVILGPTATGKTDLALNLCREFSGEIISVDSRQAYREMKIGTGKLQDQKPALPAGRSKIKNQNSEIPIYLCDLVKPDEPINAYDYSLEAWRKIKEIWGRKKIPFLVGGTGFYLDVILKRRKLSGIRFNPKLRTELEGLSLEDLVRRLKKLDPAKAKTIDTKNKYRLIRAIEMMLQRPGFPQAKVSLEDFEAWLIGLTAENQFLYRRVDQRVDRMVELGLAEEVRGLYKKYGGQAWGLKSLGYREFEPYLRGEIQLNEAVQKVKFDTHAYIRRQKTYFKKYFSDANWFDVQNPGFELEINNRVESFLQVSARKDFSL